MHVHADVDRHDNDHVSVGLYLLLHVDLEDHVPVQVLVYASTFPDVHVHSFTRSFVCVFVRSFFSTFICPFFHMLVWFFFGGVYVDAGSDCTTFNLHDTAHHSQLIIASTKFFSSWSKNKCVSRARSSRRFPMFRPVREGMRAVS